MRCGPICIPVERTTITGINPQWPEGITAQRKVLVELKLRKHRGTNSKSKATSFGSLLSMVIRSKGGVGKRQVVY